MSAPALTTLPRAARHRPSALDRTVAAIALHLLRWSRRRSRRGGVDHERMALLRANERARLAAVTLPLGH
ncbi:hypothetical protein [Galbitalea soli]|uniref:Uncharacterized protein n=1 Tax=Galbitalea soli TaxID=1268042 RepID=A0A7C9PNK4_9MICO|nr:hypothetical protein [Galbitalea soli]NEM91705.1 hypothetical protein [Galbitalea soli]NYJ30401.1 hypothetical protein [Galbitalea soli]